MKKLFFFAALCALLASCSNFEDVAPEPTTGTAVDVMVNLSGIDFVHTRGLIEDAAQVMPWESKINDVQLFVFNSSGACVVKHTVSSDELENGKALITIPALNRDTPCTFYAAANMSASTFYTNNQSKFLEAYYSNNYHIFNPGNAETAIDGSMFEDLYFPMSGYTEATIYRNGTSTEVDIVLKRIMAKVVFEWSIDPSFSANYGSSTLEITTVKINNIAKDGRVLEIDESELGRGHSNHEQMPHYEDGNYRNLWYLYESKSDVLVPYISLSGVFDADGDPETTHDQQAVSFTVPVDYVTGQGLIKRNTVYRIRGIIQGVGVNNLHITWQAEAWHLEPEYEQNWSS